MNAASKELNLRRRELLKLAINSEHSHLCSANVPVMDELFGSNLSQQIKGPSAEARATTEVTAEAGEARGEEMVRDPRPNQLEGLYYS